MRPNIDQLAHLPGLDNDYSDDYLKGGGGLGSTSAGAIGGLKPGGMSPTGGFGSQKSTFKIQNGNAIINSSLGAGIPTSGIKLLPSHSV